MKVHVRVFARLKEVLPERFELEVADGGRVSELSQLLQEKTDQPDALASCRYAVDEEMVDGTFQLSAGDEVFVLPPSSGG